MYQDPRDYYLSEELEGMLHGKSPAPVPQYTQRLIPKHNHHEAQKLMKVRKLKELTVARTIQVHALCDVLPSDQPNAGNDTFSVHTVHSSEQHCSLRVAQSDNRREQFAPIDIALANYLHGYIPMPSH